MRVRRLFVLATMVLATVGLIAGDPWLARIGRLAIDDAPPLLVVPVSGVRRQALRPSFGVPRPGNRAHQGIDIMAPRGTPVLAAADGVVTSTMQNKLGGKVVWVFGAGRRVYYYAHLDELEARIRSGTAVAAGDILGKVGSTGNAAGGPPHLHFGIYELPSLATRSAAVDPFPLLRRDETDPSLYASAVIQDAA